MSYFLLVYDRGRRRLLSEQSFSDHRQALARRFAEERKHGDSEDVEIVVIGARSLDALKRTHGRYFRSSQDLACALVDQPQL